MEEMIINNEGDFFFKDSNGFIDAIDFKQAINLLALWEEQNMIIINIQECNVEKWYPVKI